MGFDKNFGFKNFPPEEDVTWQISGQGLLPTSGTPTPRPLYCTANVTPG
jgi:hypothetical protein